MSMGWNACLSLRAAVTDAMRVVAIELVCAAEAVELRGLAPAPATGAVIACLRERVPRMDVDRFLAPDLAAAEELVRSGEVLRSVPVELRLRAPRGPERTCKGWAQEGALRCLMNNLDPEVAERPDDLVVYGGRGKAARSAGPRSTPSSGS